MSLYYLNSGLKATPVVRKAYIITEQIATFSGKLVSGHH
jgi:hypothetical protein